MPFAELPNSSKSWYWILMFRGRGIDDLPKLNLRTAIGILIAVTGNILISLALNLQKLAHRRMEEAKIASKTHQGENYECD